MLPNPVQCRGRLRDEEWPGPDVTKPLTSRWLLAGGGRVEAGSVCCCGCYELVRTLCVSSQLHAQ